MAKRKKELSLKQALQIASTALIECERIIQSEAEDDMKIRACNSVATLLNSFRRTIETAELVQRIEKLEQSQLRKVS